MAKETFARNKPAISTITPPSGNYIDLGITVTAGVLNEVDLTFSEETNSDYYAIIRATAPRGLGSMSVPQSAYKMLKAANVPATPFVIDAGTEYQARFGVPEAGTKIFVTVLYVDSNTGARYNAGTISTIVTEV